MTLRLNGSTSGYVEIDAPATAGSNTLVLPTGNGSANQFLKNGSTAGTLGWSSMVEDSSGRLGVGISTPTAPLHVFRTGDGTFASNLAETVTKAGFLINPESAGSSGVLSVSKGPGSNPVLLQYSNGGGTTAFNISINPYGGSTYFGAVNEPGSTVGGAAVIQTTGGALVRISRTGTTSQGVMDFFNSNGGVGSITTSGSGTAYNTSSDYRLKENVVPITDAVARLQRLKPSRFNFKADPKVVFDGFLAHEAQEVVPECVTGKKDAVDEEGSPVYQGIDQSKLVPLLTAALQEAVAKIETQDAAIAALETRLAALEAAS